MRYLNQKVFFIVWVLLKIYKKNWYNCTASNKFNQKKHIVFRKLYFKWASSETATLINTLKQHTVSTCWGCTTKTKEKRCKNGFKLFKKRVKYKSLKKIRICIFKCWACMGRWMIMPTVEIQWMPEACCCGCRMPEAHTAMPAQIWMPDACPWCRCPLRSGWLPKLNRWLFAHCNVDTCYACTLL